MKKIIKNNLKVFIAVIITLVISITGTVYAVDNFFARDIRFTANNENKSNGFTATNVDEALNQLYEKSDYDLINSDAKTAYYMGDRKSGNNVSINLEKGKYLVVTVNSHALAGSSKYNNKGENNNNNLKVTNGSCTLIKGYYTSPTATSSAATSRYVSNFTYSKIYECELNDTDTITYTTSDGDYSDCSQSVILHSVRIK